MVGHRLRLRSNTKPTLGQDLLFAGIFFSGCHELGDAEDVPVWARILVQATIYGRLLIGRDGHLNQSEAYHIS